MVTTNSDEYEGADNSGEQLQQDLADIYDPPEEKEEEKEEEECSGPDSS